jgi:hypothetical protein
VSRDQIVRTFMGLSRTPMTKERLARKMANAFCDNPNARAQVTRNVLAVMESAYESGAGSFEDLAGPVADWFIDWMAQS